ncbi:13765_t:CDS:2, partial [Gigaspora margarita]
MTIPKTFNHLALKLHGIIEQAIHDHAVTEFIIAQNLPLSLWNSTYKAWVRILKLKPYIEILSSSLTVQPEANAVADGKRLKEIMITESEWTEVANIIKILKPFDDITNYISGSSYPTMSIIYPTIISLRNVLLKQFEDKNISNFDANNTNMTNFLDIFNIEEVSDKDKELEQAEELADITNLTELIKKTMA